MFMTFDEIVEDVLKGLDKGSKSVLKVVPKEGLIRFHHGAGTTIRNKYSLWNPRNPLTQAREPDSVSMEIIEAVWQKLQEADE